MVRHGDEEGGRGKEEDRVPRALPGWGYALGWSIQYTSVIVGITVNVNIIVSEDAAT
jgi:hypothetical protein